MSSTLDPGTHEDQAMQDEDEHPERASVRAQLAIASAIERLAEAVENAR